MINIKDLQEVFHQKVKGDYAFICHMIASLNEHGRMGVVLPHGVLFRGASEGQIKKAIN